jgi:hypothetical protein
VAARPELRRRGGTAADGGGVHRGGVPASDSCKQKIGKSQGRSGSSTRRRKKGRKASEAAVLAGGRGNGVPAGAGEESPEEA